MESKAGPPPSCDLTYFWYGASPRDDRYGPLTFVKETCSDMLVKYDPTYYFFFLNGYSPQICLYLYRDNHGNLRGPPPQDHHQKIRPYDQGLSTTIEGGWHWGGGGGREKLSLFRVWFEDAFLTADSGVQAKKTAGAAVQRASCPIC